MTWNTYERLAAIEAELAIDQWATFLGSLSPHEREWVVRTREDEVTLQSKLCEAFTADWRMAAEAAAWVREHVCGIAGASAELRLRYRHWLEYESGPVRATVPR